MPRRVTVPSLAGASIILAFASSSSSLISSRINLTSARVEGSGESTGRTVKRTSVPLGPRIMSTILLSFVSTTSTASPSPCATATMRSPGLSFLLLNAGPGFNSLILQYPSSD